MKRSEVNRILADAETFIQAMHFHLPPWARWNLDDWKKAGPECAEIGRNMLGWDITDFGSTAFERTGLLLFTIRNGRYGADAKPYAEKIMIVGEGQETPMHFHWKKMEDIINRGGGELVIQLYGSTPDEALSDAPITVSVDGVERTVAAGGEITLAAGESICLKPGVYHRFFGRRGKGRVLVGEVSAVNDDHNDNRFFSPAGRFPEIEEDERPRRLLVSEYTKYAPHIFTE